MILTYHFTYTDANDDDFEFDDYEYTPSDEEMKQGWVEFLDTVDLTEVDPDEDLHDFYEDDFCDYMHDWCEEAAYDQFQSDPEVWEQVEDAIEYRRDPYAYYGVSRSDFC